MRFYASLRDFIYRIVAIDNLARFVFHLVIARGVSLVAIYNLAYLLLRYIFKVSLLNLKISFFDSFKVHYYRLPRVINHARNDEVADALIPCHCEQSEAIYNPKSHFRDSIAIINLVQHYGFALERVSYLRNARHDSLWNLAMTQWLLFIIAYCLRCHCEE